MDVVAPPGAYWPTLKVALYPRPTDLLSIRDVKGLEPVPANVNSRGYGMIDGEFYTGTHVPKRNIVLTFGLLNTDPTSVNSARDVIYSYFIPKNNNKTRLRFHFNNRPSVDIEGYIESVLGDRFSRDPEMQVSIICPKPNFLSTLFTKLGGVSGNAEIAAPYKGSAAGGFVLEMYTGPNSYYGNVYLQTRPNPGSAYRTMNFTGLNIPANAKLLVSTHQGAKMAEIIDGAGKSTNVFKEMDDFIYWISLYAAPNLFRVLTPQTGIPRNWYLTYVDQYIGV